MNEKPPRGNGTVCKFISVKIKENATSHRIKIYNNRKVWAVSIEDVEWITVELMDNTDEIDTVAKKVNDLEQKLKEIDSNTNTTTTNIKRELEILQEELKVMHRSRQFNITPERRNVEATVQPSRICSIRDTFKLEMNLLPVNIATACTGHKLQGRSKDTLVITSWPQFKNNVVFQNWEYVVLSRVRTLSGLFLLKPLDMQKNYEPTYELTKYMKRAKKAEANLLKKRENNIAEFENYLINNNQNNT
eukprot:scaffold922_cov53-Cyclotella_meneghiniana.AAC.1